MDKVQQIEKEVRKADDMFMRVYQALEEDTFCKRLRQREIVVDGYKSRWSSLHNRFRTTVWVSREVAGFAKARLDDYITVQIPYMLNPSLTLAQRRSPLQKLITCSKQNWKEAGSVTQTIESLCVDVQQASREMSSVLKTRARIVDAIAYLAQALRISQSSANVEAVLEILNNHGGDATLLNKLEAICHVWNVITAELQNIHERLGLQPDRSGEAIFDIATIGINEQLVILRDALYEYQINVVAPYPHPQSPSV